MNPDAMPQPLHAGTPEESGTAGQQPERAPKNARRLFGGFPQIRGSQFGVRIIRIIVYQGLFWGPAIFGNCHFVNPVIRCLTPSIRIP